MVTAGPGQKFGHPVEDMVAFADALKTVGAKLVGKCTGIIRLCTSLPLSVTVTFI